MDTAKHLFQTERPVIADAGRLGSLQVSITTVSHPSCGWLVVVETDRTDGSGWVAGLTCQRTGSLLTQQTPAGFFINVYSFHCFAKIHKKSRTTKRYGNYLLDMNVTEMPILNNMFCVIKKNTYLCRNY